MILTRFPFMKKRMLLIYVYGLVVIFFPSAVLSDNGRWDKSTESYSGKLDITVYRSPSCGCCGEWIDHLKKHSFNVTEIKLENMEPIKSEHHVTEKLASCHTAIIDGYVIEGHVPADDIKRLLKSKANVTGLTVPAMPVGTPGMEVEGRKDPFTVYSFDKEGTLKSFKEYNTTD